MEVLKQETSFPDESLLDEILIQKGEIMSFQKAYENGTELELNSREEQSAWLDYKRARNQGKSHKEAMEIVQELKIQDSKFRSLGWEGRQESEIERQHRESCQRTATGAMHK